MNDPTRPPSDADQELRRLEATVVAGDLALQRQTEMLLRAAADRAERVAGWALVGLAGVGALLVLDMLVTRRGAWRRGPARRAYVEPWAERSFASEHPTAARISRLAGPIAATGALWRLLPTISAAWRAVSDVSATLSRTRSRR